VFCKHNHDQKQFHPKSNQNESKVKREKVIKRARGFLLFRVVQENLSAVFSANFGKSLNRKSSAYMQAGINIIQQQPTTTSSSSDINKP